jgi:acetaldehyde dehydrogenase/alcohol dehydrogenase
MHNAATLAGMAFGSGFLGMCHGVAHTLGALYHVAHGRTNAILLPQIILYNGEVPTKPTSWPKYDFYSAPERFATICDNLGIKYKSVDDAPKVFAKEVADLRTRLGVEGSFQELGVNEKEFMDNLEAIAMRAYEDQCTPANPRVPMLEDIKDVAVSAYYGCSFAEAHKKRLAWK